MKIPTRPSTELTPTIDPEQMTPQDFVKFLERGLVTLKTSTSGQPKNIDTQEMANRLYIINDRRTELNLQPWNSLEELERHYESLDAAMGKK